MPPDATAIDMANVLPERVVPALSATSDVPDLKIAAPAVSAEINKDAPAAKADEAVVSVDGAAPADGEKPAEAAKPDEAQPTDEELLASDKTPGWMKARITKEANQRRAAEVKAASAEKAASEATANLTRALESLDSLTKAQAAQVTEAANKEDPQPAREAFDDPDAYTKALIDWSGRRAAIVAKAEAQKDFEAKATEEQTKVQRAAVEKQTKETLDAFAERKVKFIEEHPDYEDLVEKEYPDDRSKELQVSIPMTQVILNSEDGPDLAYYLGKNPDEATRISKLPAVLAITEMGKISARLAAKPIPAAKPAPLSTLKTGTESAVSKDSADLSMDEYGARRQQQINNERRARMGLPSLN